MYKDWYAMHLKKYFDGMIDFFFLLVDYMLFFFLVDGKNMMVNLIVYNHNHYTN